MESFNTFMCSQNASLLMIGSSIIATVIYLVPSLTITSYVYKKNKIPAYCIVFFAYFVVLIYACLTFNAYIYLEKDLNDYANYLSWLYLGIAFLCFFVPNLRRNLFLLFREKDVCIPIAFVFIILFLYLSSAYMVYGGECIARDRYFLFNRLFSVQMGFPDNIIPWVWTHYLRHDLDVWNVVLVKSSQSTLADRPPLLTGAILIFEQFHDKWNTEFLHSATAVAIQTVWIPLSWWMFRSTGATIRKAASGGPQKLDSCVRLIWP